jgi:hypothetical protein
VAVGIVAMVEPLAATATYIGLTRRADTRVEVYEFIQAEQLPVDEIASYGPSEVWRSTIPRFLPHMWVTPDEDRWAEGLAALKSHGIRYVLAHHSALDVFSPEIPELATALHRSGTLIREFSPYTDGITPHPVYDWADPDYSPIGGFRGLRRFGPRVELYRLN